MVECQYSATATLCYRATKCSLKLKSCILSNPIMILILKTPFSVPPPQRVSYSSGRALHALKTAQALSVKRLQSCRRTSMLTPLFLVTCIVVTNIFSVSSLYRALLRLTSFQIPTPDSACAHNLFNKLIHVF